MSQRAWLFIAALGLVVSALSGQAQEQTQSEQGRAETENDNPNRFSIPVTIVESNAEAEARKRSEAESSQREIDDLIAQEGMNEATQAMQRATEDMRQYSYVQTWLVGIGTVLLIATLWFTRQAISITREMGRAQTRAYLHVKSAELRWLNRLGQFHDLDHQDVFAIDLRVENAGQTPAIWYEVSGTSKVNDRVNGGIVTLFEAAVPTMRWGMIASQTSLTCPFRSADMLPQFIEAGKATQRYLRIDGTVTYMTEFNEQRHVPFSFYIDGLEIASFFGGPLDHAQWRKRKISMTRPKYGDYE